MADCPSSPSYHPTSPEEGEYDPSAPAITTKDTKTFELVGNPFQPANLCDVPRPLITKSVRCNLCNDAVGVYAYVAAFLLRRKDEMEIPLGARDREKPFFWTQAYCHRCNYTFASKVFLPTELFSYCTLKRWPPPSMVSRDILAKYSNGVDSLIIATDRGPAEFRETKQRTSQYRRDDRRDDRRQDDRRRSRSRERDRGNDRGNDRGSDRRDGDRLTDPWTRWTRGDFQDRGRNYDNRDTRDPYNRHEHPDRRNRRESYEGQGQTVAQQAHAMQYGGQYSSVAPPQQSFQQYVPQFQEPIPAPYQAPNV